MTLHDLSPRQQEIARLIAQGLSDKVISDKLRISLGTVKNHVKLARLKVGASNRLELVFKLFEMHEKA